MMSQCQYDNSVSPVGDPGDDATRGCSRSTRDCETSMGWATFQRPLVLAGVALVAIPPCGAVIEGFVIRGHVTGSSQQYFTVISRGTDSPRRQPVSSICFTDPVAIHP